MPNLIKDVEFQNQNAADQALKEVQDKAKNLLKPDSKQANRINPTELNDLIEDLEALDYNRSFHKYANAENLMESLNMNQTIKELKLLQGAMQTADLLNRQNQPQSTRSGEGRPQEKHAPQDRPGAHSKQEPRQAGGSRAPAMKATPAAKPAAAKPAAGKPSLFGKPSKRP